MKAHNLPLDTVALCSAMNACRRAGRSEEVLALMLIMKERGLPPSIVAYHTAMHALGGLPLVRRTGKVVGNSGTHSGGGSSNRAKRRFDREGEQPQLKKRIK